MYVDAKSIAVARIAIFEIGSKIRPETWIPAFVEVTHLLRSKRFERLEHFERVNRVLSI